VRRLALLIVAACQGASPSAPPPPGPATAPRVELIDAAGAPVAPTVARELARARADHRPLLVYVGATWCEPCTRFHAAAAAGELDAAFPGLRLVTFDLDRDADALEAAGYKSELVPLFAEPIADGTASGRLIQGSIKGPGAVAELTPRLRALLAPPQ
jgi:thiol-disulfide isomerase/thioredoxin